MELSPEGKITTCISQMSLEAFIFTGYRKTYNGIDGHLVSLEYFEQGALVIFL